jgi:hypothetical protein
MCGVLHQGWVLAFFVAVARDVWGKKSAAIAAVGKQGKCEVTVIVVLEKK